MTFFVMIKINFSINAIKEEIMQLTKQQLLNVFPVSQSTCLFQQCYGGNKEKCLQVWVFLFPLLP